MSQLITPELRAWIVEQARAGCTPESVLQAMKASGWQEDVAIQAMEDTLRASVSSLQPEAPSSEQGASQALSAKALPDIRDEGRPYVDAGDREVAVLMQARRPRVVVLGGLLSPQECRQLMEQARPRLARSETVRDSDGGSEVHSARTSQGMFFERGASALIATIEARVARLLHWPVDHGEGLQILRYEPGNEYKPHYDFFDPSQPGSAAVLKRGGQRVGTLVIYLNTPTNGGATTFPDAGLEVAPIQGNAVFFNYDRPDRSTLTLHAGAPVQEGEKWVATKWLREGVFV